jgi:hypothetical protein
MVNTEHESASQVIRRYVDCRIVTRGRVVLIGVGGIGLHVARALATFLASLCDEPVGPAIELVLCDGDSFAPENTYRMDVIEFGNKAEVAGRELIERLQPSALARISHNADGKRLPLVA